jgi:hypothetical protein
MKITTKIVIAILLMTTMIVPSMAATNPVTTCRYNLNVGGQISIIQHIPGNGMDCVLKCNDCGMKLINNKIVTIGMLKFRRFTILATKSGVHTATISYTKPCGKQVAINNIVCKVTCRT